MKIAIIGLAVALALGGLTNSSEQKSNTKTDKTKIIVTDNNKKDSKQVATEAESEDLVLDIVTGLPIY